MIKRTLLMVCTFIAWTTTIWAQTFENATDAVQNMGPGWNLGNTLDANNGSRMTDVVKSETCWGQPVTKAELMTMMKDAGFGAIRVPVTWFPHMNTAGDVDAAWMKRVHEVVDYVLDAGLYCILNVHHDTGADSNSHQTWLKADETVYGNVHERYEKLWQQIANEFKDYDERLLFESYNEMLDMKNSWCFASFASSAKYDATIAASAYNAINSYAQSFVDVVRATGGNNAQRNLIVNTYGACSGSGTWSSHLKDPLKEMKLPNDAAGAGHLIFQVHSYPNISNLNNAKNEIDDMLNALKNYLQAKGAPVIIGEWGTSDTNADYQANRQQILQFADYLVKKAKQYGIGTFFWMGLSDGSFRTLPAFSQPDLAECIVKAWRGDSFSGVFPTEDDYTIVYNVNYTGDWQEVNLSTATLNLSNYKGIRVEMAEQPTAGSLQVKCYGESDSKNQYDVLSATSLSTTITFRSSDVGQKIQRITLQTLKGTQKAKLKSAFLITTDGNEQELASFSPFWGCSVEMEAQPSSAISTPIVQSTSAPSDDNCIYTLQGQRVSHRVTAPGIYIKGGKKFVIKKR